MNEEKMREEFEAWASGDLPQAAFLRYEDGGYEDFHVGAMWSAWQAALSSAASAEPADPLTRWLDPNHIRLHAGEMTAQEMRSVLAVVRAVVAEATQARAAEAEPVGLTDEQIERFADHAADRIPESNYVGRVLHAVRMAERHLTTQARPDAEDAADLDALVDEDNERFDRAVDEVRDMLISEFAVYLTAKSVRQIVLAALAATKDHP